MRLPFSLDVKHVKHLVAAWLCVASLVAVGCEDGRRLPTGPSASVSVPDVAATATMDQQVASSAAPPQSSALSAVDRLFLTKTCDPDFPTVPICTVQESEAGPLPEGTQASYTFLVLDFSKLLSASVVLSTPDGSTATGHCTLSFKTGSGRCTFARGTGELAGLQTSIDVSFDPSSGVTTWEGIYHFAGRD